MVFIIFGLICTNLFFGSVHDVVALSLSGLYIPIATTILLESVITKRNNWPFNRFKSFVLLLIILQIVLSLLNKAGDFNRQLGIFEFHEFFRFLPHSYNYILSGFKLVEVLGIICYFICANYFYKKSFQQDRIRENCNILVLLGLFSCFIAFIGVIDRYTDLLNISSFFNNPGNVVNRSFSIFGYRGNYCSNFIIFIPIFYLPFFKPDRFIIKNDKNSSKIFVLCFIFIIIQSLAIIISLSRLGIILCIFLNLLCLGRLLKGFKLYLSFISIFLIAILVISKYSILNERILHYDPWHAVNSIGDTNDYTIKLEFKLLTEFEDEVKVFLLTDSFKENLRKNYVALFLNSRESGYLRFSNYKTKESQNIAFEFDKLKLGEKNRIIIWCKNNILSVKVNNSNAKIDEPSSINSVASINVKYAHIYPVKTKSNIQLIKNNSLSFSCASPLGLIRENFSLNFDKKLDIREFNQRSSGRSIIYRNCFHILKNISIWGYGLGSFPSVYHIYKSDNDPAEYWCHSDPLQTIIEMGAIGALVIGVLFINFKKCTPFIYRFMGASQQLPMWNVTLPIIFIFCLFDFPFQVFSFKVTLISVFFIHKKLCKV